MKVLKERKEVAAALNSNYPVIWCKSIEDVRDEFGWNLGKVRVASGRGYDIDATLRVYKDELSLTTSAPGCCLHDRFGWGDVEEMAERANLPRLQPESKFVLVIGSTLLRRGMVAVIDTGKVEPHCSTPLYIGENFRFPLMALGEQV